MRKGFLGFLVTAMLLGGGSGLWGSGRGSAAQAAPNSISSFGQSIANGFQSGIKKLSDAVTPDTPVKQANDPVSLNTKAKPSPELYVSLGLMAEQKNNYAEAERQYRAALKAQPKHLGALLAYARLKDRQNQLDEAIHLYKQAIAAHPNEAIVYNDLGLCYARHKRPREALPELERAVQLKPKEMLYRNNLATLLVELGDVDRAFQHLVAAHGEAVAYYNLGYLMQKKGQPKPAAVLFAKALEKDPSLVDARIWLDKLGVAPPQATAAAPLSVVAPEAAPPTRSMLPPSHSFMGLSPEARRLPPVSPPSSALPAASLPENAPLPPSYPPSVEGPQIGMPNAAPLPPNVPAPTHMQPMPSFGRVLVEP